MHRKTQILQLLGLRWSAAHRLGQTHFGKSMRDFVGPECPQWRKTQCERRDALAREVDIGAQFGPDRSARVHRAVLIVRRSAGLTGPERALG
jgi:hypothetical protein